MNVEFKVLILCTGNSCRSQMAEAMLRSMMPDIQVMSAGVKPASAVAPQAIQVLGDKGYATAGLHPKNVASIATLSVDLVISVCDNAREQCPVLPGEHLKIHKSFEDPYNAQGSNGEKLDVYRRVCEEIEVWLREIICPLMSELYFPS